MKRLFILLTITLLLTACGSNENITEEMHKDVEQTLTVIETSLEKDRDPTIEEWDTIFEYQVKYDSKLTEEKLSDDERLLETLMEGLISEVEYKQSLDTANDSIKEDIEVIRTFMKTGEY